MPTAHNSAQVGQIAKTVLMPGDPLRSEFLAHTYLTDPVLVNNVRGVQGYTGTYRDVPVTIMASGMGIPSLSVYSWELFNFYDVDNIIRIGSAGGISDDIHVHDIIAAQGASTDSGYIKTFGLNGTFAPLADYTLLSAAAEAAHAQGKELKVGNVLSSDAFYHPDWDNSNDTWKKMGIMAVEMEAAGLYANAAYAGKRALCLCTITNHLYTGEELPSDERRKGLGQMVEIALDVAVRMAKL